MSVAADSSDNQEDQRQTGERRWPCHWCVVIGTIVAVLLGILLAVQTQRFTEASLALSRYESPAVPTTIAPGQFRIIFQSILNTDHAKVLKYRIESLEPHYATLRGEPGEKQGSSSRLDEKTHLHVTDITVLFDHIGAQSCVKVLPKVGGAQGYSVFPVKEDFRLEDHLKVYGVQGVYEESESVTLYEWNGHSYIFAVE